MIAVVLFHFNPTWLSGGFAGVDVFFVISGFLMTGIISRGIEQDNFSILKFYVARANRIIPALAVLCMALLVFGWFYLTPLDYKTLGKHAAGSIGFLSNVLYWRESGYFDASSLEKWLLHTWSLSVEWQFYIIYPLILISVRKLFSVQAIKPVVLIGTVLSFILCVYATYQWPTAAYYLLPTRAWEMMIGGIAYLYPIISSNRQKRLIELTGVILIIGSYFTVSAETFWPGYIALFPVLGSFLIIIAQRNDSLITGNIVFQKIGLWSYSIYLWHWPLVVAIYSFSLDARYVYFGMFLSVLLGFLSHKYIEQFRFSSYSKWKELYRVKPIYISAGVIGFSILLYLSGGANTDLRSGAASDQAKFLNEYALQHKNLDEAYWLKCNTYTSLNDNDTYETDPVCVSKNGDGGVFLWGDSHAEALSLGLRTLLKSHDIPFYQKTSAGCQASLNDTTRQKGIFKKACDSSNKLALESIAKIKPTIVVIAQANSHEQTDWSEINKSLLSLGVSSVILVGPVSQWKPSLPRVMIKPNNWKKDSEFVSDSGLDLTVIKTDEQMKSLSDSAGIKYVSLIDKLCYIDELNSSYSCRVRARASDLLQVDYGHLSESGSLFVVNNILSRHLLELYENSRK